MPETQVDKDGREFKFTSIDFERVRKLIYDHAGISLSDSKQELVYSRLSRRLRATGISNFTEYLLLLENNNEAEWEEFANSLTTNLTSFFREAHHFPVLAEHLRTISGKHPISLWCSAASTGEEAFTMAMTVVETLGSKASHVKIIATDLDTKVLATARAAMYPEESIAKLSDEVVKRLFIRGTGAQSGMVKIRQELRDMVTFRQLNLLGNNWSLRAPIDVIFCRNVMIYFDKPTQLSILKKFVPLMRHNGLLFAGHSESFHHAGEYFKLRGKTVYELSPLARKHAQENERNVSAKDMR